MNYRLCLVVMFLLFQQCFAGDSIITIAGGGSSSSDGPALSANFYFPGGIAIDSAGNVFIPDTGHNRICKLTPAGNVVTIAGTGVNGYGGDGLTGLSATFSLPTSVALDAAGNLYIADQYSPRVRKMDTAGIVTTVAGGGDTDATGTGELATAARFSRIVSVAVNPAGEVLFIDNELRRIFRIAADGTLHLVAGNGNDESSGDGGPATQAAFNVPQTLIIDPSGNIFVADTVAERIRRIDAASGNIDTYAGSGNTEFVGDGGPATAAGFEFPSSIALDAASNLFIADTNHGRIRRVDAATKIVTTVAGNGAKSFYGDGCDAMRASFLDPFGMAVDAAGNLVISDSFNNRIRKMGPGLTSNADTDCDGFPDNIETLAGSSPTDAASTPFSGQMLKTSDMNLKKLQIQISFLGGGKDKVQVQGIIDVPEGISVTGKTAALDVGGLAAVFSLDEHGKSTPKGINSLSISTKPKNGGLTFTGKFDKGTFANTFAAWNLFNGDAKREFLAVPVAFYFNDTVYLETGYCGYNAKTGKAGKASTGGGVVIPGGPTSTPKLGR